MMEVLVFRESRVAQFAEENEVFSFSAQELVLKCSCVLITHSFLPMSRSRVPAGGFRGGRNWAFAGHHAEPGSAVDEYDRLSGV